MINEYALKSNKIVNDLKGEQKRILEVPKKYLTKVAEEMNEGIKKTAKKLFDDEK